MLPVATLAFFGLLCSDIKDAYQAQSCCHNDPGNFTVPDEWTEDVYERCRLKYDPGALGVDALDLVVVGAKSPIGFDGEAQTCMAVVAGDRWYMVDVGDGCARRVGSFELPWAKYAGLLLTHFHSDHMFDLSPFRLLWVTNGVEDKAPFRVYGPPGVQRVVDGMLAMGEQDLDYRYEHHNTTLGRYPQWRDVEVVEFALPEQVGAGKVLVEADELTITAFEVNHRPVYPAVGYRFDYRGRSLVIGGDTIYQQNFIDTIAGADVLVADIMDRAFVEELASVQRRVIPFLADLFDDVITYHASPEEVVQQAIEARVGAVLLTHLVPSYSYFADRATTRERFVRRITRLSADVARRTHIAEQGMLVSLPLNGTEVITTGGATPWDSQCDDLDDDTLRAVVVPIMKALPPMAFTFDEVPRATTPLPGGWTAWPDPVLNTAEPPAPWAPDLRGVWSAFARRLPNGTTVPTSTYGVQRIEQANLRVTITASGVVHDMIADGSVANGVHDVLEADLTTRLSVKARFEMYPDAGAWHKSLNLLPQEPLLLPDSEFGVVRWIEEHEGERVMLWRYPQPSAIAAILAGEEPSLEDMNVYVMRRVHDQNVAGAVLDADRRR